MYKTSSLLLGLSLIFASCQSFFSHSTSLEKKLSKIEKKKGKSGENFDYDDVYASSTNQLKSKPPPTNPTSSNNKIVVETSAKRDRSVSKLLKTARSYVGTPHRIGGMNKRGMDCSGLMVVSFQSIGLELPRSSSEQASKGKSVKISKLQKGDLVFFRDPKSRKISHVGVVSQVKTKNDIRFIHTSTSKGVREDSLFSDYWHKNFIGARRII